jgi:hypothetical protein
MRDNEREVLTFNKALPAHSFEERSHHYVVARCGIQNTGAVRPPRLLRHGSERQ